MRLIPLCRWRGIVVVTVRCIFYGVCIERCIPFFIKQNRLYVIFQKTIILRCVEFFCIVEKSANKCFSITSLLVSIRCVLESISRFHGRYGVFKRNLSENSFGASNVFIAQKGRAGKSLRRKRALEFLRLVDLCGRHAREKSGRNARFVYQLSVRTRAWKREVYRRKTWRNVCVRKGNPWNARSGARSVFRCGRRRVYGGTGRKKVYRTRQRARDFVGG